MRCFHFGFSCSCSCICSFGFGCSFFFSAVYLGEATATHMQNPTGAVCINTCEHTHLPWYLLVFAYNNFTFNNFWLFDEPAAAAAATTAAATSQQQQQQHSSSSNIGSPHLKGTFKLRRGGSAGRGDYKGYHGALRGFFGGLRG